MSIFEPVHDAYDRHARLYPGIITLLPIWLGINVWFPINSEILSAFTAIGGTFVFSVLMAQLVRDRGKNLERRLFKKWGGPPSVLIQSFKHSALNRQTLIRYHTKLAECIPELWYPTTLTDEESDSRAAHEAYESASDFLREKTRDKKKFHLIARELQYYGFRRNLRGLKPIGITCSIIGIILVAIRIPNPTLAPSQWTINGDNITLAVYILISLIVLLTWLFIITERWVKEKAYDYATRLLEACTLL